MAGTIRRGGGFSYVIDIDAGAVAALGTVAAGAAVTAAGGDILRRSRDLAPRKSGRLAASGHVTFDGETAQVAFEAPYARRQHEARGFRHPGGGQAGYLSEAVAAPETIEAMRAAFESALRAGGGR